MALYKTSTELATAVLRDKNIIAAEEAIGATDLAYVQEIYAMKHAELREDGQGYWSISNIPNEVFLTVRDLVWNEIRDAYGRPQEDSQRHSTEEFLKKKLKRQTGVRHSGHSTKAEYF